MTLDGKAFGQELCALLKNYIRRQLEPVTQRIAALEARSSIENRGAWSKEKVYKSGDVITYARSLWLARSPNCGAKPGSSPAWQRAVGPRPGIGQTKPAAAKPRPIIRLRKQIVRKT
jgi:hypothetical protein